MRDMSKWFRYNWAVREEWLDWCERLSNDELLRPRVGGAGGILATFVHILDVIGQLSVWSRELGLQQV